MKNIPDRILSYIGKPVKVLKTSGKYPVYFEDPKDFNLQSLKQEAEIENFYIRILFAGAAGVPDKYYEPARLNIHLKSVHKEWKDFVIGKISIG